MQATQSWHGYDWATDIPVFLWFATRRCSLCEREMCSVVVVVKDVRVQQPLQLSFIQDDHMVKQIPAAVAHPTLGNPVLPLASETGLLWLNAKAPHCVDDFLIEARAAIKNQVARGRVIGKSFAKLLDNPGTVRMLRHMAVENSPSIMRNDKEAIQRAERERRHGKDRARKNLEEGEPKMRRRNLLMKSSGCKSGPVNAEQAGRKRVLPFTG